MTKCNYGADRNRLALCAGGSPAYLTTVAVRVETPIYPRLHDRDGNAGGKINFLFYLEKSTITLPLTEGVHQEFNPC